MAARILISMPTVVGGVADGDLGGLGDVISILLCTCLAGIVRGRNGKMKPPKPPNQPTDRIEVPAAAVERVECMEHSTNSIHSTGSAYGAVESTAVPALRI